MNHYFFSPIVHQTRHLACGKGPCCVKCTCEQENNTHTGPLFLCEAHGKWDWLEEQRISRLLLSATSNGISPFIETVLSLSLWIAACAKLNVCLIQLRDLLFSDHSSYGIEEVANDGLGTTGVGKASEFYSEKYWKGGARKVPLTVHHTNPICQHAVWPSGPVSAPPLLFLGKVQVPADTQCQMWSQASVRDSVHSQWWLWAQRRVWTV